MSNYDWIVIGVYLLFMVAVGYVCRNMNKNSSDFFRGGGQMNWWLSGVTAMMAGLSLWTFSAAGVRVYETGFFMVLTYFLALLFVPFSYFIFAPRFRRMRVITAASAIRRRYGKTSEQYWVWISVPIGIFYSGLALHIIAVFTSGILGLPINYTVIILGCSIVIMGFAGGAWAVAVSNFLQGILTIVVVAIVCIKVFNLPEVGGVAGFFDKLPNQMYNFNSWSRPIIWIPFLITQFFSSVMSAMDLNNAGGSYLSVKNDKHAKRQVLLSIVFPFVPLLVFLPIMASVWLIPNMQEVFPALGDKANEGAYAAIAKFVLPSGMLGLFVSALFAVQASTLDSGLNKNAGFVVCNFYRDILRPKASEKELLVAGRVAILVFGALIISIALTITSIRTLNIFQFTLLFATILQVPLVIPMAMGTIIKRTPPWSAWVTSLAGMSMGAFVNLVLLRTPDKIQMLASQLGLEKLAGLEVNDFRFIVGFVAVYVVSFGIYFLSMFFYKNTPEENKKEIEAFFIDLKTPILDHEILDNSKDATVDASITQYFLVGGMTAVYGLLIMLGVFIPNLFLDRMLFIYGGGIIFLLGLTIFYAGKMKKNRLSIDKL